MTNTSIIIEKRWYLYGKQNTYNTAVDVGLGENFPRLFHDRIIGSPLGAKFSEGVDTASGRLIISRNDFSLEETGGMDLN